MYNSVLHFCIFLFVFSSTFASDYEVIEDKATLPFLSPDLSERKTLKIQLPNGLEAYLISDPSADKSGALLSVKAGSWDDPKEFPGIAHFLEHMLFLGTEKFPDESSYQYFISENGGVTNAFTSAAQTAFLFSVNNDAFPEALDRFSQFFITPLFNPSGVSRELQAINQEYNTHLDNDDMRAFMVDKELSNPEHPYFFFSIGNSKTLSKVSQQTLKDWYKKKYSANLMRLVVYSPLPLEELKTLVVNDFSDIPNINRKTSTFSIPITKQSDQPSIVYIESVKNERTLTLVWNLPEKYALMTDTRPTSLLCYVLGHEGEESLLAQLKREKFADQLRCGLSKLNRETIQFRVEIELTDDGISHIDDVITRVFQAIAIFKNNDYPKYLYDEMKRMEEINYQYQPRTDAFVFMMKHAGSITEDDFSTYPEHSLIIQKFDPQAVKDLALELTPRSGRYYVIAPASTTGITPNLTEQWLGVKYSIQPIDEKRLSRFESVGNHDAVRLPQPNPFIPKHLTETSKSGELSKEILPKPELILDDKRGKVYFAKDKKYQVPEISWVFEIKTPQVDIGSPVATVLTDFYIKALRDALNNVGYQALLAGLNYEIQQKEYGILFHIHGYSENAELFFDEILNRLKSPEVSEAQFEIYRQMLRREYQNFGKQSPLEQATEYIKCIIYKKFTTAKQKALAINRVSYDKYQEFVKSLFKQTYVQGVLYGNMEKKEADRLVEKLLTKLDSNIYQKGGTRRPEVIILSDRQGPYFWEVTSKAQGNATILAIELPTFSFKERAAQQIFMQAIENPFFATLRTKQQTGYVVYSSGSDIERQLFSFFSAQSSTHAVRDLLSRFELFLEGFLQELPHEINEKRFDTIKQSLINELKQPVKNISETSELLYKLAFENEGDFDWFNKRIKGMEELTHEEFIKMSQADFGRGNKRRVAVLLKGVLSPENSFNYSPMGSLLRLRKTSVYTSDRL